MTPDIPETLAHEHTLDIRDPMKWQLKIRLHLEKLEPQDAEIWLDGMRLILTVAGGVVRDQVHRRTNTRCYICNKVFKDGKPAAEAGYYDAERNYVKIYACNQAEFNELMKACKEKEDAIALAEDKAKKAARQAAIDARRAVGLREIRE